MFVIKVQPMIEWVFLSLYLQLICFSKLQNYLIFMWTFSKLIYIYNTQILSVCMAGYRLDPWRPYRHETGIITFSMTWRGAIGENLSKKLTTGANIKRKVTLPMLLLWENFDALFLCSVGNYLESFITMFKKILIFQKRLRHQCL
jgi:hypothetical protein